jgi:alginate O-acetyltransferase complex protein AlgI
MLFNSLRFLYGFLPPTYLVYWRLKTRAQRHVWLTLTGYVFYSFWNYRFCALMALSTLVSYTAGRGLLAFEDPRRRRLCLVVPIAADLLLLGFFKYTNFLLDTAGGLAALFGRPLELTHLDILLPVGISFYTFHTISYIVDSYRRTIVPTRDFFEFACYVSLFSQLVAGPIVRFREIQADLEAIDVADRKAHLDRGWSFFAIGLAKKVLLADTLAASVNPALAAGDLGTASAWLCILGYTYQIYFDFSGYSDMAVGLGYLFGLRIPQNFNSPYKATDPSDFWRRWHISLSSCLRDYVYIPMGGNRSGALGVYRNLMLTMLIGGLWHGASWTFVFWGAYHGLLLSGYRAGASGWDALPAALRRGATFVLVVVGWVFFRAGSFGMALAWLRAMFVFTPGPWIPGALGLALAIGLCAAIAHGAPNSFELRHEWGPPATLGLATLLILSLGVMYVGEVRPFLYFQF